MKIATWNVNSIRARFDRLMAFLAREQPDVLCLQELKVSDTEFPRLELKLIEKLPWAEMPRTLAGCDLLVDQLFMGWYGLLAIEGMSLGKAVVCHLRADFVDPACPVVDADSESLVSVLRALIKDPAQRAALGAAGQAWARERHDQAAVGRTLLAHYEELRK